METARCRITNLRSRSSFKFDSVRVSQLADLTASQSANVRRSATNCAANWSHKSAAATSLNDVDASKLAS